MKVVIDVIAGPDQGATYEFEGYHSFVLGRATHNDAGLRVPKDPYFSRYHLLLEFAPDGCAVRDLKSRNGVFVNGVRVSNAALENGDEIEAGKTKMRIAIADTEGSNEPPASEQYEAGTSIGQFELLRVIGEGAFGRVYEARDAEHDRRIALKILQSDRRVDDEMKDYFLREIEVMSGLDHPHIVKALGAGRHRDDLWLAMELIDAPNLESIVESSGVLAVEDAQDIGTQLLEALLYAHAKGIVHRDIKPSNILVAGTAGSYTVKVADFGLAKSYRDLGYHPLTRSGEARGTPHYMPPEQVMNAKHAGPPADIYGFGATMYWSLTRSWHVDDSTEDGNFWRAILMAPLVSLAQRRPELPSGLCEVIDRTLQREVRDRYESTAETLRAWQDVDAESIERTRSP